ncbi:MAG: hypothetical protein EOP49_26220 [Sphingobacteriales bacterium]|nr:MAG: hypothetical protein EOP49_26220 [Sphingobacteriales bacterium]
MKARKILPCFIFMLPLVACKPKQKPSPVNIAGTYAMEVSSSYGITRDTIQVTSQSVEQNLYFVTHKVRFIKKLSQGDTTYRYVVRTHIATYEEHLGHLQDVSDGTLFPLYHEEQAASTNLAHYSRIK